jgi:hypothetical protein
MSAIDKKIDAVEFLLVSFFEYQNDEARVKAIREKCAVNEFVAIYARMTEDKLNEHLVILQSRLSGE